VSKVSETLSEVAAQMETLEAENVALHRQLDAAASVLRRMMDNVWPTVKALYEQMQPYYEAQAPGPTAEQIASSYVAGERQPTTTVTLDSQPQATALTRPYSGKGTGKSSATRYSDDDVRQWQSYIMNGSSIREVSKMFNVDPATIKARLAKIGGVCTCGIVIGTEEEGVIKGHDGVCGYCREEKAA